MRYLLVGLGNIGQKRRRVLGSRCVATVDPFNSAADYPSPQDCDAKTYDAAILAVPNESKLELLEYFLEHGKHVLVEKPLLFPDAHSATRLEEVAGQQNVIWYTAYNHRFEPLISELKQRLDAAAIGPVYHGRLFYGNGTVADVAGSWRDVGLGVIEDLGCHLLDLAGFLLDCRGTEFEAVAQHGHEAAAPDHALMLSADGRLSLEMTYLSWKNTFAIDLYGEHGSLHLNGLCKWGPSELIERQRVRPSGVPHEQRQTVEGPDVTWQREIDHFERLVSEGASSADNDRWISQVLRSAGAR